MQTGGVWKPPCGSVTKSRQAHIRWQQNGPTVVGTRQTKPFLQRWSFESFLSPSVPPAQSAFVVQADVHSAPVLRGSLSAPGSRQTWDAHVGERLVMMLTAPGPSPTLTPVSQGPPKIGVMFGNPETTTGGNALKFYASVRMDIRRVGALKDGDKVVGNRTRVKVVKNKMAPPFREVEFDILYGEGISREGDLVDLGAECGAVEKSGAWFGFEGDRIGQGRENAKQFLRDHTDVARRIEAKVLAHFGIARDVGGPALPGDKPSAGATVHAFTPQPKPANEKKSR